MFGQVKSLTSKDTVDLTFSGTKINPYSQEYDSTGKWTLSGYIDTYISHYSDTVNSNGFVKFPTIAPRNNQFGLNIIQLSAKYQAKSFRATTTLFTGDCPKAAWSSDFNAIQEANLGFKLCRKLWLDMGFFRTHIGLESIQPRENMTLSLATTTYFEPYFLSGAKSLWKCRLNGPCKPMHSIRSINLLRPIIIKRLESVRLTPQTKPILCFLHYGRTKQIILPLGAYIIIFVSVIAPINSFLVPKQTWEFNKMGWVISMLPVLCWPPNIA